MHNINYSLNVNSLSKRFGRQLLFKNVSFSINTGDSFYITGPNGSGKSTLLQIIAGLQKGSTGSVEYFLDNKTISQDERFRHFGFTSPAVNPYDMLTAVENLEFAAAEVNAGLISEMLEHFGLYPHRNKPVGIYSSGMKQRLKLILAMINSPGILMLDEPCSNLDSPGKELVFSALEKIKQNSILIIATNEHDEINICKKGINLGEQNF